MKIALLAPAGAMHRYSGSFGKSLHYAPLTLTTLAALVPEEADAEVVIYDETAGKIPLDIEADLIGITCITGTAPRCYAFADYYRKRGVTVFMGGPRKPHSTRTLYSRAFRSRPFRSLSATT